jgi:uncharacterized protein (TIGR01777 family)
MKVAIAGGSGMVGSALTTYLTSRGHTVTALKRNPDEEAKNVFLDVTKEYLETFDGVINLAGENIAAKRWTYEQKKIIRESRTRTTGFLARTLATTAGTPTVFINASAVGYYGDRGDDFLTEASKPGAGFLPSVCNDWERATDAAKRTGLRVVQARIGVVIGKEGGALKKMLVPFKLGGGGILGTGRQYMSWISIRDVARSMEFILTKSSIEGPVNLVSPYPVTNAQFTKVLGTVLGRPTLLRVPANALKLILGNMAQEMLLEGNRVAPTKLEAAGFRFEFPELQKAIEKEIAVSPPK